MKKLILYGFILSVMMNIFQLMFATKKLNFETERYKKYKVKMTDSLNLLKTQKADGDYFSLAYDEKAQDYLKAYDIDVLMPQIKEKMMDLNSNPKGNRLVPYDNMILNKVRFLNHRWIIADFSGSEGWGEVIIKYFIENDGTFSFETVETVMYPQ